MVDRIITELGVFDVDKTNGLTLAEIAPGVTVEEVQERTGCTLKVADPLPLME